MALKGLTRPGALTAAKGGAWRRGPQARQDAGPPRLMHVNFRNEVSR